MTNFATARGTMRPEDRDRLLAALDADEPRTASEVAVILESSERHAYVELMRLVDTNEVVRSEIGLARGGNKFRYRKLPPGYGAGIYPDDPRWNTRTLAECWGGPYSYLRTVVPVGRRYNDINIGD